MSKKKRSKKTLTMYSLFGKIGDILFFPIIFIAFFSSFSMFSSSKANKPISVLGFSLVTIKSGSMVEMGFYIGDTVITQKANKLSISLGDIIAFYNFHDSLDTETDKQTIIEYNYPGGVVCDMSPENITPQGAEPDLSQYVKVIRENEKTVEYAQELGVDVYFHQVIGIYVDEWDNIFYKTKGSHNSYADGYVREDFVVGKYKETPRFFRDIIAFCSSGLGMILLVCIPLSILVLMDCFSLIEQVELLKYEKSIVEGSVKLTDSDFKTNFDPITMELHNKVYVYFMTPPEDREKVKNLMWRDLLEPDIELTKKEKKELELLNTSISKLDESVDEYWKVWLLGTKGAVNKRIQRFYNSLEYEKLYNKVINK